MRDREKDRRSMDCSRKSDNTRSCETTQKRSQQTSKSNNKLQQRQQQIEIITAEQKRKPKFKIENFWHTFGKHFSSTEIFVLTSKQKKKNETKFQKIQNSVLSALLIFNAVKKKQLRKEILVVNCKYSYRWRNTHRTHRHTNTHTHTPHTV